LAALAGGASATDAWKRFDADGDAIYMDGEHRLASRTRFSGRTPDPTRPSDALQADDQR